MGAGLRSAVLAAGVVAATVGASSASADTVNFPYVAPTESAPNPYAEWTVPAGVNQATFDLYGAQGAGDRGGKGAHTTTTVSVVPGTTYRIYVGGRGQQGVGFHLDGFNFIYATRGPGGYNGGGAGGAPADDITGRLTYGGGGATDVRTGPSAADRALVAGGGGGQAGDAVSYNDNVSGGTYTVTPGAGGNSDADGEDGVSFFSSSNQRLVSGQGGKSGSHGGGGGAPYDLIGDAFDCQGGADADGAVGGTGSPQSLFCPAGAGGGGGLVGGGGGGGGAGTAGGGGGGSNKIGSGTVVNGDRGGDGQASVTFTTAPPPDATVKVDGPLTPFVSDGSARFKLGTVLEIRVKPSKGGELITDLKPQVNLVRTGNPSGPQTPTVPVLKRSADAGKTMRYSASFGQYQFYAATTKSQFNGGKDLATGKYRVDVTDPIFPGAAHKVARNFAIVP